MRFFLILTILLSLVGCQSSEEPHATPSASASPGSKSTPKADGTPIADDTVRLRKTTIKTKQGQKWEMEASQIDWHDNRAFGEAKEVTWWLLDENDKKWVRVDSPRADVDRTNEIVTFIGETVAHRLDFDEDLKVQHLVYKGKERMFYGSQGVEWRRGTVELTGETLTATSELDKVQLKGSVKGKTKGGFKGLKEPRKADSSREN